MKNVLSEKGENGVFEEICKKYVMIIDDEPDKPAVRSLRDALAVKGYEADIVDDPEKVKAFSSEEMCNYPAIIIDYNMVNIYGDALIPLIREKNLFAYLIVYTGFPNVDKYETLKKLNILGADFWAEKGDTATEKELFVRVDYAFRRAENIFSPLHLK